jgi:hypothetical protein
LSIRLANTTGVDQWELEVIGTDELSTAPSLTGVNPVTHIVTSPSTVVTLTYPNAAGRAIGFKSIVTSSGVSTATTFGVYTIINGSRVGFVGEIREGNPDFGWATKVNPLIRAASSLPPLTGILYATLMENPLGNVAYVRPTGDMILPAFVPTLSGGVFVEVGQAVATPAFTATYTASPDSVILTDDQGSSPKDVSSTPTSFTSNGTFTKNTYGATATFTITAGKDLVSKTSTTTFTWVQKVYWGVSSAVGPYDSTFIQGLAHSVLTDTRSRTITDTLGASDHLYYAVRTALSDPAFSCFGEVGGFERIAQNVSVTNAHGFTENYNVYRTTQTDLATITVTVI